MLKNPHKYFNFGEWEILINEATDYNFMDELKLHK